ncbi:MAG: MFS transporter [Phototrophicaceae bacterium]
MAQALGAIPHEQPIKFGMWWLRALQFLSIGALGLSTPFFSLYLNDIGFSETYLGILLAIGALLEMTLIPMFLNLADRRGLHRLMYRLFIVGFAVANLLYFGSTHIAVLTIAFLLVEITVRPSIVMGGQLVLSMQNRGVGKIGNIRFYAALGFAVGGFVANWLIGTGGFTLSFLMASIVGLSSLAFTGVFPPSITEHHEKHAPVPRRRGFKILMVGLFLVSIGLRAGFAFWFIHIRNNVGVSDDYIGWIVALFPLGELPFFLLFDPMVKRLGGRLTFILGLGGFSLFWIATAFVSNVWWLIPLLAMRGLVFVMYHLGAFVLIQEVSDPRNIATNQALAQITIPSLAALITSAPMGWVFENWGAFPFFSICTVTGIVGTLVLVVNYRQLKPSASVA